MIELPGYTIEKKLGQGGFGTVYSARQNSTGQVVALKTLNLEEAGTTNACQQKYERFDRESKICAQLNHPHIVRLLDKGKTPNNEVYAIFEYVPGENLKDLLLKQGPLPAPEAGDVMGQVLDALTCAHSQGIVHRDLKPQNIMVAKTGAQWHAKVLDFGIGTIITPSKNNDVMSLTVTREMLGTPSYSAPEQLRGEPPTYQSDLYSWALVFLECLTGQPVMYGATAAEIFHKQLGCQEVPLPAGIISHPVAGVLRKALKKSPRERCSDTAKLWDDFKKTHLADLVGLLETTDDKLDAYDEKTEIIHLDNNFDKRQVTALCCHVRLTPSIRDSFDDQKLDLEALELLHRDQLNHCTDIISRHGGFIAGILGESIMAYFGYPKSSDTDIWRTSRCATNLLHTIKRRADTLREQGLSLQIQIGLHTGMIISFLPDAPSGLTAHIAQRLAQVATPNTARASESSYKRLLKKQPFITREPLLISDFSGQIKTFEMIEKIPDKTDKKSQKDSENALIGRKKDLLFLSKAWGNVIEKNKQCVLIYGEAGIGKTHLLKAFNYQLIESKFLCQECRCLPEYQNNALFPFIELLRSSLNIPEINARIDDTHHVEKTLKALSCDTELVMPVICSWLSLPFGDYAPSSLPPKQQKSIFIETLAMWLFHRVSENPGVLIVEDMHWADPTTCELVTRLISNAEHHQLMILLTARPEFSSPWKELVISHRLNGLNQSRSEDLVKTVAGDMALSQKVIEKIVERTDGVPLFIEELTRMIMETQLQEKNGVLDFKEHVIAEDIPLTLKDSLIGRLDHLYAAKPTAQLAATIGRQFDYQLLCTASLKNADNLQQDIDDLVESHLLISLHSPQSQQYMFRHALIHDAAYDTLSRYNREQNHKKIAQSLLQHFPQRVEENPFELARHFSKASQPEFAVEYGIKAIKKQIENSADDEIISMFDQTITWISCIDDEQTRIKQELLLNSVSSPAITFIQGWGSERMLKIGKRNKILLRQLQEDMGQTSSKEQRELLHKNDWSSFVYHHCHSNRKLARELGEKLLRDTQANNNHTGEVAVACFLAHAYLIDGDFIVAKEKFEMAIDLYDEKKDANIITEYGVNPLTYACGNLGLIEYCSGHIIKALQYANSGIELAEKSGYIVAITSAYIFKALLLFLLKEKQQVFELLDHFYQRYQSRANKIWVIGHLHCLMDWASNKTLHAIKSIDEVRQSRQHFALSWFEPSLATTYIDQGHYDEAIELMDSSLKRCLEFGENSTLSITNRILATAHYYRDGKLTKKSQEHFMRSIKIAQYQKAKWLELEAVCDFSRILEKEGKTEEIAKIIGHLTDKLKLKNSTLYFSEAESLYKKYITFAAA